MRGGGEGLQAPLVPHFRGGYLGSASSQLSAFVCQHCLQEMSTPPGCEEWDPILPGVVLSSWAGLGKAWGSGRGSGSATNDLFYLEQMPSSLDASLPVCTTKGLHRVAQQGQGHTEMRCWEVGGGVGLSG